MDEHAYSSSVIEKAVTAAAQFHSFAAAAAAMRTAEIDIGGSRVRRLAGEVGTELVGMRDRKVIERRRRQLKARTPVAPPVVVVEVDGGHLRTRAADGGPGVHHPASREAEVACFATLESRTSECDPNRRCPTRGCAHVGCRGWCSRSEGKPMRLTPQKSRTNSRSR